MPSAKPKIGRTRVAADIRSMFNAPDRKTEEESLQAAIQEYAISAPKLSAWLKNNLSEGFSVFDFPFEHQRTIRTTNSLERINKEIRRRTRLVGVFPKEASCLRLVSALQMEISEEWQIGKHYCAGKTSSCLRTMDISYSNLQKNGCVILQFRKNSFVS